VKSDRLSAARRALMSPSRLGDAGRAGIDCKSTVIPSMRCACCRHRAPYARRANRRCGRVDGQVRVDFDPAVRGTSSRETAGRPAATAPSERRRQGASGDESAA
jgi:hypothetical protein